MFITNEFEAPTLTELKDKYYEFYKNEEDFIFDSSVEYLTENDDGGKTIKEYDEVEIYDFIEEINGWIEDKKIGF